MAERNLDFNRVINRKGTDCLKYDFAIERGLPEDVLPLWVADMDFKTSSYIEDALIERSKEAIFGYSEVKDEYFDAVSGWMKKHHNWDVKKEWLVKTPGVVFAIAMAIRAFTKENDGVLIQQPVYYPFAATIKDNNRKVVSNDLKQDENGYYYIDFEDFEQKIVDNSIKLFVLCSPHNPVGRVWTREELTKIGDICLKHNVFVVSDEIHNDFAIGRQHTVFPTIKEEYILNSMVCTSPSKTFNLASMMISNIFIPDPDRRAAILKEMISVGIDQLSILGLVAAKAAYQHGEEWYEAMIKYVSDNIEFAREYVKEKLPGVKMAEHQGTYLIWLDFRDLGLEVNELDDIIINKAKLWLDSGKIFGSTGEGFQRINVACPRSVLEEALERIRKALEEK